MASKIGRGPRAWARTDERIHDAVCEKLFLDPWVDASSIDVRVSDGDVTLVGEVETREERWHAEDLAWSVPGVRDVFSHVRALGVARPEPPPVLHVVDSSPVPSSPRFGPLASGGERFGTGRPPPG